MAHDSGLLPTCIRRHLETTTFGRRVYYVKETDSTNRVARDLARQGEAHGTVVTSDYQRSGRGRGDRLWLSPPAENLLWSLILRPSQGSAGTLPLTLAFSVALASALSRRLDVDVGVKWPNDLVTSSGKLGGILSEAATRGSTILYLVVGIGLNVNTPAENFPDDLKSAAASMRSLTGKEHDRACLLAELLGVLEAAYSRFERGGFSGFLSDYTDRLRVRNRVVKYEHGGREEVGVVIGVREDGALVVKSAGGKTLTLYDDSIAEV